MHDDESVHCYKPYNSKLLYNSHNTLCFPSKTLHKQTVLISLGTCNKLFLYKMHAYVKLWRENKEYCLFVCLFIFGKRPIMQKLFNVKCLYTNVMRPSEYLNNLGEVHN